LVRIGTPLVSVALCVHNGAAGLPAAIETILAQTFDDFELIAINNGSTEQQSRSWMDSVTRVRIKHLRLEHYLRRTALHHFPVTKFARRQFRRGDVMKFFERLG
jgi:hypothetical protein